MSNRTEEAEVPTQSLTQNPPFFPPTSIEIRTTDTSSDTSSVVPTSIAEAVSPISDPGSNLAPSGKDTTGAGALPPPPEPARVYQICSEGFIRRQLKVRESGGQRILYTASTNSIFSRKPKISIHSTASSNPSSIKNNNSSSQEQQQQQQQTLIASAALHIFSRDGIDLHLETIIDRNGKPCQVKIICPSHDPKSFCFLSSAGFMRWQQQQEQEQKWQDGGNGSSLELVSDGSGRILAVFSGTNSKWPSAKCGRLMARVEGRLLDEIVMSCLAILEQERRRWSPAGMVARWRLG